MIVVIKSSFRAILNSPEEITAITLEGKLFISIIC
jgi:hypothetical protein